MHKSTTTTNAGAATTAQNTPPVISESIRMLAKLEERGRTLRNQLDAIESRWEKHYAIVRKSEAWVADCDARGVVTDYNFGDVLA